MTSTPRLRSSCLTACALALLAVPVQTHSRDALTGQRPDPIVTGAPFAADSTVTVMLTMFGASSPVEQRVVARLYRDNAGRVRREQALGGFDAPTLADADSLVVTIIDPVAGVTFTLNPATRTAYRVPMTSSNATLAIPELPAPPQVEESLGTRQIEGITVTGRKSVVTLAAGGDGRPVEISDEQWESRELGLALLARHRDSRTGTFEHRLTNITRIEPSAALFTIPAGYTVVDVPVPSSR